MFAREPAGVFWGLVFPAVLLIVLGFAFPGAREPSDDLGGFRLVDLYSPIVLTLGLVTLAFATLPVILATYRERGVLRRISTTPAHPRLMVLAQLTVHLALAVAAAGLALIVALVVFSVPAPGNAVGFVASFLLAAAALLAVGMVVGAMARTAASGQGIGMALYFPVAVLRRRLSATGGDARGLAGRQRPDPERGRRPGPDRHLGGPGANRL